MIEREYLYVYWSLWNVMTSERRPVIGRLSVTEVSHFSSGAADPGVLATPCYIL